MSPDPSTVVITDTSVLINFLKIDRLDLLGNCSCKFLVTNHVRDEISANYSTQAQCYEKGLFAEFLQEIIVNNINEIKLFGTLMRDNRLGEGECSALAAAIYRGYSVAIDDRLATKVGMHLSPSLKILTTQDIMILIIQEQLLTIAEADSILTDWKMNHRFSLKIASFSDLI